MTKTYLLPIYRRAPDGTLTFLGEQTITERLARACADPATRCAGDQHRTVRAVDVQAAHAMFVDLHDPDVHTGEPHDVLIPHHVLFEAGVLKLRSPERDPGDYYANKRDLAAMLRERLTIMAHGLSTADRARLQRELVAAEYVGD